MAAVLERLRIGGRTLLVIERLGHFERPTFRAVEQGLTREVRCVQVLPYSAQTVSRLRLLSKISRPQANLPSIVDTHRDADKVHLVTQWIDGPTLHDYLQQCYGGREPWPSTLVTINLVHNYSSPTFNKKQEEASNRCSKCPVSTFQIPISQS